MSEQNEEGFLEGFAETVNDIGLNLQNERFEHIAAGIRAKADEYMDAMLAKGWALEEAYKAAQEFHRVALESTFTPNAPIYIVTPPTNGHDD